ncbi:unnamed protein product [Rotaria socialis]
MTSSQVSSPMASSQLSSPVTNAQLSSQVTNAVLPSQVTRVQLSSRMTSVQLSSPVTSAQLSSPVTSAQLSSPVTSAQLSSPVTSAQLSSPVTSAQLSSPVTSAQLSSPVTSAQLSSPVTSVKLSSRMTSVQLSSPTTSAQLSSTMANAQLSSRMTSVQLYSPTTSAQLFSTMANAQLSSQVTSVKLSSRMTSVKLSTPMTSAQLSSRMTSVQLSSLITTHRATSQSQTSITTVTSSPVTSIFWAFDNNVNDLYNVYNGVPTSVTYYSPGINGYGTAAQFSYSISSINIPSPYVNLQNRSYTFDCWVNPGTTMYSNDYLIFFVCPVQQNDKCMQVLIRYGKPMLTIWYGDCLSSNSITVNVWTHLAFVFDYHANQATLYVNGVVDTVCTSYPSFQGTPTATSWIGWSSTVNMYYSGLIDQLSLVTRVKTAREVLDAATLVLYYSFDNNVLYDSGPNFINGTGINVAFASGRVNQAAMLNTTPSYVTASNLVLFSLLNQPYSFSFWINAYSTTNATLVYAWKSTLNNKSCLPILGFTSLGSIVAQKRNSTTVVSIVGPVISPHTWVHIAHTYSPSDGIRLFINGTLVASSSWLESVASKASTINIAVGHCINATLCSCSSGVIIPGQYNGLIDEFRFYSRRLNTSDILALTNP